MAGKRGLAVAEPAEYPPERGEAFRWLPFPVKRPAPREAAERPKSQSRRKSGGYCDVMATLGKRPASPDPKDMGVSDWRPV